MAKETPPPHDHSKPGTGGGDINPRTIGERQPVESLNADNLHTDSHTATYIVYKRSGTIYADAQQDGLPSTEGTDAFTVIQHALDNIPSEGGRVHIRPGTYLIEGTYSDATLLDTKQDGTILTGEGWGSVIRVADNTTDDGEGQNTIRVSNADCQIQNIKIDGNYQNNTPIGTSSDGHNILVTGAGFEMSGVKSVNSTGDGVELHADDATVSNCHFVENYEQNIHIWDQTNITITNNILKREQTTESLAMYAGSGDGWHENIVIKGNVFLDDVNHAIRVDTEGAGLRNSIISDNVIVNPGTDAIQIRPGSGGVQNVEIHDNNIRNVAATAINILIDSAATGERISIKDNTIEDVQDKNIQIAQGTYNNVTIAGNGLYRGNLSANGNAAVLLNNNDGNTWANIRVEDNEIVGDSGTPLNYAIQIGGNNSPTYNETAVTGNFWQNVGGGNYLNLGYNIAVVRDNDPRWSLDVRNLKTQDGNRAYHDGSGAGESGPAQVVEGTWFYENGATEAAGSGNAPTASNYAVGQIAENTDDDTIWIKKPDGAMKQLA